MAVRSSTIAVLASLSALTLLACKGRDDPQEGTEPFECRDGVDNDADGYFDCDDNGCWGSPDCGGGDDTGDTGDTGDTSDTSDTSDTGVNCPLCYLQTVRVVYTQDHVFDETQWGTGNPVSKDTICDFDGPIPSPYCDCKKTFNGTGTFHEADGMRVTFEGTWTEVSAVSPEPNGRGCEVFLQGAWWDSTITTTYHSFHFTPNQLHLNTWVAHRWPSMHTPVTTSPYNAEQWFIFDMYQLWNQSSPTIVHDEDGAILGLPYTGRTYHHAEFYFNE